MLRGIYTAASGMTAEAARQDVVANNLANVDTPGFKRDRMTVVPFQEYLIHSLSKQGIRPVGNLGFGVDTISRYNDFSTGSMLQTGVATDLAIDGDAMFAVSRNGEVRYTRAGHFCVTKDGALATPEGDPVLGVNGPVRVNGSFTVSPDGAIMQGGRVVATLQLASQQGMVKGDDGLYDNPDGVVAAADFRVNQGALERANVNPIREMIEMINVSRSYETNQRALTAHDETLGRAVNDLAK